MTDLAPALAFIRRTKRFIITCHETPDGDAIGSECAMLRAVRSMGKEGMILNADPTPRKFAYMDDGGTIGVLGSGATVPQDVADYSLLILDTNDVQNIGQVASVVLPRVREHFIIDHHELEEDALRGNCILASASSTAEILYRLLGALRVPLDLPIAEALYTGIVYDTGSFVYPKTTALTFRIAQALVEAGVTPNTIYARVYESNSISALVLQARVLATLELVYGNRVSILTMRRQMIIDSGATYEEADQLINIPLRSEDIRVSIFFKENLEGLLRCSLRSKGAINVAEIALFFGGGGHRTAAGFKCRDSLETTRAAVLQKLGAYFP